MTDTLHRRPRPARSGPGSAPPRPSRRRWPAALAAIAVMNVLVAVGWVLTDSPGPEPTLGGAPVAEGRSMARLLDVDPGERTVTIDTVTWLTGDEAVTAWRRDYPGDDAGPPNDYYVVNEAPERTKLAVGPSVRVALVRLADDGDADTDPGTLDELATYAPDPDGGWPASGLYWVTVEGGVVVAIEEQYVP
ncbi:MAG TPA: hypothetical protein VFO65_13135 [Acidimicrobiales bacterium]|nr:hypothetical protein [Acidimicrobiales bacterium]